jgi:hypothetical protein
VQKSPAWSPAEIEAIVADYFSMLEKERPPATAGKIMIDPSTSAKESAAVAAEQM